MNNFIEELVKIEDACDRVMSSLAEEKAKLRHEADERIKAYDAEKKRETDEEIRLYKEKLQAEKDKALGILLEKEKRSKDIMDREFRQKHELRSDEIVSEITGMPCISSDN